MAQNPNVPVVRVEIGFTADTFDPLASVAWTDVTAAVVPIEIGRGRQQERGQFDGSTCTLKIKRSHAKDFDPENTGGAYSPNVRVNNRIRVSAGYFGVNELDVSSKSWIGRANATLAGTSVVYLAAVGVGSMSAQSVAGTAGFPVTAGATVIARLGFRATLAGRSSFVSLQWYNAGGAALSVVDGAAVVSTVQRWTKASVTATVPAGAAYAAVVATVSGAAAGELHDVALLRPQFTGYIWDYGTDLVDQVGSEARVQAADGFRPLSRPNLPRSPWELEVLRDKPKAYLRLGESQSALVASDSSGNNLDGTYQGQPNLGLVGLVEGDSDTGMSPLHDFGQRMSLPYRTLITGYPWAQEILFRKAQDRAALLMIFAAYDGAQINQQFIEVFIGSAAYGSDAGRIIALLANPYPTNGTQSVSTITVDDGELHHLVIHMPAANSLRILIDSIDRTNQNVTGTPPFPTNFIAGYAVGNVPAVTFGDFGFATVDGDELDEAAIYDGVVPSDARFAAHWSARTSWAGDYAGARIGRLLDAYGWPAADRALDVGGSPLQAAAFGGAALLAYLQEVAESDSGGIYVDGSGRLVFADRYRLMKPPYTTSMAAFGPSGLPYELPLSYGRSDIPIINEAAVQRTGGVAQPWTDQASVDAYGPRTYKKQLPQLASDSVALGAAQYLVIQNKDERTQLKGMTIRPHQDPAALYPQVLERELGDRITAEVAPAGGTTWTRDFNLEYVRHVIDPEKPWETQWTLSQADTLGYAIAGTSLAGAASARAAY